MSLSSPPLRALVIGGTSGIGHGIALALAKRGDVEVTIAGRSAERGASIVEQLNNISTTSAGVSSSSKQNNHKFVAVDGFDLKSVKALSTQQQQPAPDILVMTQGMATLQGYTPTDEDGIDQKLQLHYFSRFYLTSLLAPNMKPNARVLTVLSAGVHEKYNNYDKDFELKKSYSIKNAANAAGYYTDAGFEALSEQNPELVMAHAAPGMVNTNWGTEFPALLRIMVVRPMMSLFGKNKEDLGETLVSSLMKLPKGYSLLDQKGTVIQNNAGIKHTREERDVILEKTLAILPDL
jgi:hypothetical protein